MSDMTDDDHDSRGQEIERLAAELEAAWVERLPYTRLVPRTLDGSIDDAYRVQAVLQNKLLANHRVGEIVGWKVALTSAAMQTMIGVGEPLAGAVFASRVQTHPARVRLDDYQHVGLEFEVAVRTSKPLGAGAPVYDRTSIVDAVGAIACAYELVEDRNADFAELDAFSLVADNAWNAGVVLGEWHQQWANVDLENGPTRAWLDGELAGEGRTGDALGHPFEAVAWLSSLLSRRGITLPSGQIVLTGSSITTRFPEPGQHYRFEIDGLGAIEASFEQ